MVRCPGQDQRSWKPEDIFETQCPGCGQATEVFKDEPKPKRRKCGQMVFNPKIQLGCVQWCKYAEQCIADRPAQDGRDSADKTIDSIREKISSQKCKSRKEK